MSIFRVATHLVATSRTPGIEQPRVARKDMFVRARQELGIVAFFSTPRARLHPTTFNLTWLGLNLAMGSIDVGPPLCELRRKQCLAAVYPQTCDGSAARNRWKERGLGNRNINTVLLTSLIWAPPLDGVVPYGALQISRR